MVDQSECASSFTALGACDVVILAGGLGTRIRSVLGDTPKLLAPAPGGTLLDFFVARLVAQGARRIVPALGHRAEAILDYLRTRSYPVEIAPVVEPAPLGTAGALRYLRAGLRPGPAVVMNGDTLTDLDLGLLPRRLAQTGADAVLACVDVEDAARFGRVIVSPDGFIERFAEKGASGPGTVNAGIYALSADFLDRIAAGDGSSLENDFFQTAAPRRLAALACGGRFVDIGTPEGFAEGVRLFGPDSEKKLTDK
jgi:NDP-sugar pyrophosphorylase family protein